MALVIGGNAGIGGNLVKQLLAKGYTVYATTRGEFSAEQRRAFHAIEHLNVSDIASAPQQLASAVAGVSFDVVIYNAGVLHMNPLGAGFDAGKMMEELAVNTIAPTVVVNALVVAGAFKRGSKLALISSSAGVQAVVAQNKAIFSPGYVASKAAMNMLGTVFALALQDKDVSVLTIHPGTVSTNMSSVMGAKTGEVTPLSDLHGDKLSWISPEDSAGKIIATIAKATQADTGDFFDATTGHKWIFQTVVAH